MNGELKSSYYEIQDGDVILMRDFYTVSQILDFLDVKADNDEDIYVNHEKASMDTPVYDNFTVSLKIAEEMLTEDPDNEETDAKEPDSDETDIPKTDIPKTDIIGEPVERTDADRPDADQPYITVTVNGKNVVLSGKKDYIYVDVFDRIDFDLSKPHGRAVITKLNGQPAQYVQKLKDGDALDIYWEK